MSLSDTQPASRPLRKDAERNRQRILDAARDVFAEQGIGVTLDAVARRAGVGVGTVYRRFADKEQLIDALFESRIDAIAAIAERALERPDPWDGIVDFFERSLALHLEDRGLRELVFKTGHGLGGCAGARERIKPPVLALFARAQDAGVLRADVSGLDTPMLQVMLAAIMDYTRDIEPDLYRRYLRIVLDGLRADGAATPLPVDGPDDGQLDRIMS